ncbi:MAG: UTP--glucose-1-phosphate uridylyltransferase, partial [Candidatus Omnitrophica bacterium]|nr:UTP--glucose-1-phosphate uridylyltransferase [Candidatus Omnitrophota bacterium]
MLQSIFYSFCICIIFEAIVYQPFLIANSWDQLRPSSAISKDLPAESVQTLIEFYKDRYAQIAGESKREAGYQLSIQRLRGSEERVQAILGDPRASGGDKERIAQFMVFGKGGIFHFWDDLTTEEKKEFLRQLEVIDIEEVEELYQRFIARGEEGARVEVQSKTLSVPEVYDLTQGPTQDNLAVQRIGEEAFRKGNVAYATLAGGSGSRLGYEHPKILFPASQVMSWSLAKMTAQKIRALSEKYGKPVPWLIMTSDVTHEETVEFFSRHIVGGKYFGEVPVDWVRFVRQRVMPQVTNLGEFVLEKKNKIIVGGFGHGDIRDWVLQDRETQQWLARFGVKYVSMLNVDNAFMPGPASFGAHIRSAKDLRRGAEHMSLTVVEKNDPNERVGMVILQDEKLAVIEYNQVPAELTYLKYVYTLDGTPFVVFRSDRGIYTLDLLEEFERRAQESGRKGKELGAWMTHHLASLQELPEEFRDQRLGRECSKETLTRHAHLWFRLGSINQLIWSLSSFQDSGNPLEPLPVVVARNKTVEGFDPETFRWVTVSTNKFEIMAFHGFIRGLIQGAVLLVSREENFAPIKEMTGPESPQSAAHLYSEYDRRLLTDQGEWQVSQEAIVELSPAFFLASRQSLNARLGENGFVGANTQIYLSGTQTLIGRNFRLERGERNGQFILRVEDEYDSQTNVRIGDNVAVRSHVSFHLRGENDLIIDSGLVFDFPLAIKLAQGEKMRIDTQTLERLRNNPRLDNPAEDFQEDKHRNALLN